MCGAQDCWVRTPSDLASLGHLPRTLRLSREDLETSCTATTPTQQRPSGRRYYASCFMLHASCFMLHAHASCFMLHASCFTADHLGVAISGGCAWSHPGKRSVRGEWPRPVRARSRGAGEATLCGAQDRWVRTPSDLASLGHLPRTLRLSREDLETSSRERLDHASS